MCKALLGLLLLACALLSEAAPAAAIAQKVISEGESKIEQNTPASLAPGEDRARASSDMVAKDDKEADEKVSDKTVSSDDEPDDEMLTGPSDSAEYDNITSTLADVDFRGRRSKRSSKNELVCERQSKENGKLSIKGYDDKCKCSNGGSPRTEGSCAVNGCGAAGSLFQSSVLKIGLPESFQSCCEQHDRDYCDCGTSKKQADSTFYECSASKCSGLGSAAKKVCLGQAATAYTAVWKKGVDPFEEQKEKTCKC